MIRLRLINKVFKKDKCLFSRTKKNNNGTKWSLKAYNVLEITKAIKKTLTLLPHIWWGCEWLLELLIEALTLNKCVTLPLYESFVTHDIQDCSIIKLTIYQYIWVKTIVNSCFVWEN